MALEAWSCGVSLGIAYGVRSTSSGIAHEVVYMHIWHCSMRHASAAKILPLQEYSPGFLNHCQTLLAFPPCRMVGHIAGLSRALTLSLPRLAILGPNREAALVALLGQPAQEASPVIGDDSFEGPLRGGSAGSIDRTGGPGSA